VQPQWRKDGRELYYLTFDGKVMAVGIDSGASLKTGSPTRLFGTPLRPATGHTQYAVSSDGQRFLVIEPIVEPAKPMTVVLNWTAGY
jgi:hypothetical protein